MKRLRVEIQGAVQGVGFRPFVYRLAREMELAGWVLNDSRGVFIEVEGNEPTLRRFLGRLPEEIPPRAVIHRLETRWLEAQGLGRFTIIQSDAAGEKSAVVLPDIASCCDCLREVTEPQDRRRGYPFTNCTNCGPRFTIVEALPYDRPNTSMRRFSMCRRCHAEYVDPENRRFHAQPNACPDCGPRLALWDRGGDTLATEHHALNQSADAVSEGKILALKGLGGFHLIVDAGNQRAVERLRQRKGRYEKPLALMVGDLAMARKLCVLDPDSEKWLTSPEAPILLLPRKPEIPIAAGVAPKNPYLGLMLPYTPLHHLLMHRLRRPVVATSGNLSDEPICTGNREALERLGDIADLFLVHDRPIVRHVDDSVLLPTAAGLQPLRRARGLAPLPVVADKARASVLALGAHLKNTVALGLGEKIFLSQHIGDMETPQALEAFERVIRDFLTLYEASPAAIAHDLHPDYVTTRWVRELEAVGPSGDSSQGWKLPLASLPRIAVQHHHAHLASCLADNGTAGQALGVAWDGTGYGTDGTVWGGEFLIGDLSSYRRVARLRPFLLPGGDAAVREPRRAALALLWQVLGVESLNRRDLGAINDLSEAEAALFAQMLERGIRSPWTSSAGRLFDGAAALLGIRQRVAFEGQAAMELEFLADPGDREAYPMPLGRAPRTEPHCPGGSDELLELDWRPLVEALIEDSQQGVDPGIIAARFHNALVESLLAVAREVGEPRVALTGGCFQNRRLLVEAADRLRQAGFEVLLHRQVPANDGGISLGQALVASAQLQDISTRV